MTFADKLRTNEYRLDRELDEHLTERDREAEKWRPCPVGPGDACYRCPKHIRERCRE